ncbi:hypothetical protein JNO54_10100 [Janibacter sp. YIM B02568]|uniref:hypothetical protein n=1 Tax=Janibacter endophyticus TaxID=2806261 RepID=UPI001950E66C|nr:hypothetical protein [Janibacter endophyticus]MBM6546490.1 hypothetical protein [Janibacter endophyticus]
MKAHPHFREYVISTLGLVCGGAVFIATLLGFGWNPGRTANSLGYASNFFDIQGRALLDGNLAVPPDSLGIEGFVIEGKTYMYFPPFPAIARLPILMTTDEFDGRLTVLMMALAWSLFAAMSVRVVWLARSVMGRTGTPRPGESVALGGLIAAITGGTVLTFDAALPWVYHEVYLWAAAFFMLAAVWLVRFAIRPTVLAAAWVGAAALGAVLTRTTGGFALAIVCLSYGSFLWLRSGAASRVPALSLILAGAVPISASVLLNQVKFGHPYLFPLEHQVFSSVNEHRRLALESNGGTITGPQFIPSTTAAYLRPDGIRFTEHFPWVSLPARPAHPVGEVILDQTYRTGSVPAFMPLLTLLTLIAVLMIPVLLRRRRTRSLLLPMLAGGLLVGPVLMYGYITHRYTSEFVPLLAIGSAVGLCGIWSCLEARHRLIPLAAAGIVVVSAAASLAFQALTGYQAAVFGERGPALQEYVSRQLDLPGAASLTQQIVRAETLPEQGRTDSLLVQGDCDALYVNTGDTYDHWVLVEQRPQVVGLTLKDRYRVGRVPLFRIEGPAVRQVAIELTEGRLARFVVTARDGEVPGPWFTMYEGSEVRLGLGIRSDLGYAQITSTPGGHVAFVPWATYDPDTWITRPGSITALDNQELASRRGLRVQDRTGVPLPLCQRVLAAAQN